jgi:hypothetical protein
MYLTPLASATQLFITLRVHHSALLGAWLSRAHPLRPSQQRSACRGSPSKWHHPAAVRAAAAAGAGVAAPCAGRVRQCAVWAAAGAVSCWCCVGAGHHHTRAPTPCVAAAGRPGTAVRSARRRPGRGTWQCVVAGASECGCVYTVQHSRSTACSCTSAVRTQQGYQG